MERHHVIIDITDGHTCWGSALLLWCHKSWWNDW